MTPNDRIAGLERLLNDLINITRAKLRQTDEENDLAMDNLRAELATQRETIDP